jgi:soluble P-type ATPase
VVKLEPGSEAEQKMEYVEKLGNSSVAAVGQGTNDRLMLKDAGLGICIVSPEGTAVESLLNSDILVPDILSAFNLLLIPDRLKATLRQ